MSDEFSSETETGTWRDAFIPLVLLSLSFIVLLGWQVSNASSQRNLFESAIARQEPTVAQSKQVQAALAKLATDLIDLAQTDDTAKAIAAKYIQKNGAAAPAASSGTK